MDGCFGPCFQVCPSLAIHTASDVANLYHSIVNSWLTYAACFGVTYSYGGGPVAIFSPLISAIVQWLVLLGVSELASAFPSSGVSLPCHSPSSWLLTNTPGAIPFHVYSCARALQGILCVYSWYDKCCCLVGEYCFWYNIHCHFCFWNLSILDTRIRWYSMASIPVLSTRHFHHV